MIRIFLLFLPFVCLAENFDSPYRSYVETLSYLEYPLESRAILFSATPGMGKTTISQTLSNYFHAVVISSDSMRQILKDCGEYTNERPVSENEKILHQFAAYSFDRLYHEFPNHFYIFDSSVDRRYPDIKNGMDAYTIPSIVIRLEVPREVVEERLVKREENPDYYLRNLDRWFLDYESFDLSVVDIFFDNSSTYHPLELIEQINFALNSRCLKNKTL